MRLAVAAVLLVTLPGRAHAVGLADDLRALGWLWPPVAAVIVVALALWHVARARRLRSIFVSYRRSDSTLEAGQVVASLRQRFRKRGVFHDVGSLAPGADFRGVIAQTLNRCDAALVIIGPEWATCAGADGRPRLTQDDDIVRSEVVMALASGALVVPVLVANAALPKPQQLPADLHAMLGRTAVRFDAGDAIGATTLTDAIRSAPMRCTPAYLALCHASVLVQLAVFFLAGGLLDSEFTTAVGIVAPPLAAVLAVVIVRQLSASRAPVRVLSVLPLTLAMPLLFVASSSALVVLRALNFLSFDALRVGLTFVSIGFAAYTGVALAGGRSGT